MDIVLFRMFVWAHVCHHQSQMYPLSNIEQKYSLYYRGQFTWSLVTVRSWGATREVMIVSRTEMLAASSARQMMRVVTMLRDTAILSLEVWRWSVQPQVELCAL